MSKILLLLMPLLLVACEPSGPKIHGYIEGEFVMIAPASLSSRDDAKAALDSAKARMDELEAQLKTAGLGARGDRIAAAKASVDMAEQTLKQAEKKLIEATPFAPADGIIEETFFRPGEYVAAGQPVVNLLPPGNVKIRFYVPEGTVSKLKAGQGVAPFGDSLHVGGTDKDKLEEALAPYFKKPGYEWHEASPSFEGVFIRYMADAQDNFKSEGKQA